MNGTDRSAWFDQQPRERFQWAIKPAVIIGIVLSCLILVAILGGLAYGAWSVIS